jgi:Holliday junction resolvasome RuvABC endonuclease subunit
MFRVPLVLERSVSVFFFLGGKQRRNMKILSFDMGIKNLAYVIVEKEENESFNICLWTVEDVVEGYTKAKKPTIAQCVEAMVNHLQTMIDISGVTHVLIEQQPVGFHQRSNTMMKCLSHVVQGFFVDKGIEHVAFVSPKRKLKMEGCPDTKKMKTKDRYKLHKQFAIDKTLELLPEGKWREWFLSLKKQDDAADAFLQAYQTLNEKQKKRKRASKK